MKITMRLSDLKIRSRLYIAILAILVSVAYINFSRLAQANQLNTHTYEVIGEAQAVLQSLVNIETGQRGFAITAADTSLEPYNTGKQTFKKHLDKTRSLTADNPRQQERLKKLEDEYKSWLALAIDPVIDMRRDVAAGKTGMENVVIFEQAGAGMRGMDAMRALLAEIGAEESALLDQRSKDAAALQSLTAATLIGGGVVAALLAALLAMWLARNITRPLQTAVDLAKRVARGDLTARVEVKSKDETGELMSALKGMNESLVRIVSEVRAGTETIATASGEIASGNMDLSSRTEQQASSLEETASSVEELTSTVQQNADNARQANGLAMSASEVASKGGAVVSQVVETMGSINQSAKKIVDIIGVIDGIAFQTNILALNAAVEAARAGEQGRGFAVVAAEVRSLAQRSAAAAKEIKELIGDSVEKVETGAALVDQAGATMQDIVASVKRVTDIIAEISAASEEQRSGIEQVNQAISQMDHATQQNASLVEEAAAAAQAMQQQSNNLAQAVSVFKLDGMQAAAAASAEPAGMLVQATSNIVQMTGKIVRTPIAAPQPRRIASPAAGPEWEEF
jgi:methyl-accepting chemotaxis protein